MKLLVAAAASLLSLLVEAQNQPTCTNDCFLNPKDAGVALADHGFIKIAHSLSNATNPVYKLGDRLTLDFLYNSTRPFTAWLEPVGVDERARSSFLLFNQSNPTSGRIQLPVTLDFPFEKPFPPVYYLRVTNNATISDLYYPYGANVDLHTVPLTIDDPANPNPSPAPPSNYFTNPPWVPASTTDEQTDYDFAFSDAPNRCLFPDNPVYTLGDNVSIAFDVKTGGVQYDVYLETYNARPGERPVQTLRTNQTAQGPVNLTVAIEPTLTWPQIYYFRVTTNTTIADYSTNIAAGNRTDFHSHPFNVTDPAHPLDSQPPANDTRWVGTGTLPLCRRNLGKKTIQSRGLSTNGVIGAVVGSLVGFVLIGLFAWGIWSFFRRHRELEGARLGRH